MNQKVYLAGPITGLTFNEAQDWRDAAVQRFKDNGIIAYSPLRAKDYLKKYATLSGTGEEYANENVMSTQKAVVCRDKWDATRCDLLFVNLLGAKTVSIGTMFELAWAYDHQIPIVCAIEKGNIHDHMFVREVIAFPLPTLEAALTTAISILRN
jgi:nucleoside 2-deoxyribosyltransferase